jgi:RTX calcium-binding nonapeptide repeat (4 copies)
MVHSARLRTLLPATILALLLVPGAANAASTLNKFAEELQFDAAAGVTNDLTVTGTLNLAGDETIVFADPADVINVGAGLVAECEGEGTNTVTCTSEYSRWFADLDDMGDQGTANGTFAGNFSGGDGADTLVGSDTNALNEEHFGDAGDDTIDGRGGADELTGEGDTDTVRGGPGDDFLYEEAGEGTGDTYDGGPGADEYELFTFEDTPQDLNANLGTDIASSTGALGTETDTIPNIEDIDYGGEPPGNAIVTGSEDTNNIATSDGNDVINPQGGADFVRTRGGDDNIDARDGSADIVRCGNGNDSVQADQLDVLTDCENVSVEARRPVAADLVAPDCTLRGVRRSYGRTAFFRGIRPDVDCNEGATLEMALVVNVKRGRLIARAGDLILAERTTQAGTNVRLRPARRFARQLSKRRGFRARLVVEARDEFGNRRVITRTIKVKKAKRKRR